MKKDLVKGIIWSVLVPVSIAGLVFFLMFFVLGIHDSCVADDVITAQDRINSAYQFLKMICSGLVMVGGLAGVILLKDNVVFNRIKTLFVKNEAK